MSVIAQALKAGLDEIGIKDAEVWWEPLGAAAEMCGPSGGWMYRTKDGDEDGLGINAGEAVRMLILNDRLRRGSKFKPPRGVEIVGGE